MRGALPALALAAIVGAFATGAATGSIPQRFRADTAAAYGKSDVWLLGGTALLRSSDAGRHFVRVGFPKHLWGARGVVPSLVFADARDGYAYSAHGLFSTHDGGETWRRSLRAEPLGFAVGGGHAFAYEPGRGLERSPVSLDRWRLVLPLRTIYPVGLAAAGSRVWLIGPPWRRHLDTIRLSDDHGRTFVRRPGPCFPELGGRLEAAGRGVIWAVCPSGMMAGLSLSTDDGRSFSVQSFHEPGGESRPSLTNAGEVAPFTPRIAVLDGGSGPVLRTTDEGRHWKPVHQPGRIDQLRWLDATTRRVGWALVASKLWRTTDAGASWRAVTVR